INPPFVVNFLVIQFLLLANASAFCLLTVDNAFCRTEKLLRLFFCVAVTNALCEKALPAKKMNNKEDIIAG
ncbi:MAG: hypothetical protein ABIN95_05475, partial [Mucilaginibacter sp.]